MNFYKYACISLTLLTIALAHVRVLTQVSMESSPNLAVIEAEKKKKRIEKLKLIL